MYTTTSGKSIDISQSRTIAAGGEGRILEYAGHPDKVVKIYHSPRPEKYKLHLESLSILPDNFIAPKDIILNDKKLVVGFTMSYINFTNIYLFNNLFNKGFCTSHSVTYDLKIKILSKLKEGIEICHKHQLIQGDINQYNIAFDLKGNVFFMDVDSYASPTQPHSQVLLEDIRDYTTKEINKQTDAWAYDILAFWTLCFVHPFKWVLRGNSDSLEHRIKTSKSILSNIPGVIIPKLYEAPTGILLDQFKMIFNGRRFMLDYDNAVQQITTVIKPITQSQSLNIRELFSDVFEVNAAMDKIAIRTTGNWWKLISTASKGFTSTLNDMSGVDAVYPGEKTYITQEGNWLVTPDRATTYYFGMPKFYYASGYLSVLDYDGSDKMYNFDIDKQLGGNVDHTISSVFAKSILFNEAPIQNFGKLKKLQIPVKNYNTSYDLPDGIRVANYNRGYIGSEYIKNNVVEYSVGRCAQLGTLFFDYLPHFASNGIMLFVPDDGKIEVFNGITPAATLDAPMCTKSSKLYFTNAGILILENKVLYLANTK